MLMVLLQVIGDCNMMANIRGGVSMVSDICTVICFVCFVLVQLISATPLDCLG